MLLLRTSERRDLKRCPQRWHWGWVQGYKTNRIKNPFWFGIGVHEALASWYQLGLKRGPHPAETWEAYCADEERFIPTDYEEDGIKYAEAKSLGTALLTGYVEHWGKDPRWSVVATEQTFQTLIPKQRYHSIAPNAGRAPHAKALPITRANALAQYLGTFDGVYRDLETGSLWLMEHKTAKAISLKHLPLDDQAGSYWFVASKVLRAQGLIKPGEEIVGIMYNFIRKGTPDDRPRDAEGYACNKPVKADYIAALRHAGYQGSDLDKATLTHLEAATVNAGLTVVGERSKIQPKPLYHREPIWRSAEERLTMLGRIQDELEFKQAMLNGTVPVFKNPTWDCSWDCDFYRLCMLHEANADWEEFLELSFHKQDPYEDHRANRKSA